MLLGWMAGIALGALFGWAWGRAGADRRYRAGWSAGYEDARSRAQTLAREHDFAMAELRLERMAETAQN